MNKDAFQLIFKVIATVLRVRTLFVIKNSNEVIFSSRTRIKMADKVEKVSRPMKFPYTFSAKLAQFPIKHYLKNQWIWKYYAISLVVCLPVFNSISKLGKIFK